MNLTAVAIPLTTLCLLTIYGTEDQDKSKIAWEIRQQESQINKKEDRTCSDVSSRPFHLTTSYSQGPGIGYNKSYTSLQGFLSPIDSSDQWLPFVDARWHIFNDGKSAVNVGLGMRYIASQVWGINAYYDHRKSHHQSYNQAGLGFEVLGSFWDFRLNGYLPIGKKKTSFHGKGSQSTLASAPAIEFLRFVEHHAIVGYSNIPIYEKKKVEFAFKGVDASAGFQVGNPKKISLNFAAGPYYYAGYYGKHAVGGQGSITARWSQYIALTAMTSYDNLFRSRSSGSISLSLPLGNRGTAKKKKSINPCGDTRFLDLKLTQGAHRNEIIVLDKHRSVRQIGSASFETIAINPQTGEPYIFWHVNNTSSSNGTYESPYPLLSQAQAASSVGEVIYVYPGDGTTTGMDAGITLKDNQKLFGAGTNQTLLTTVGVITIPAQASGMPQITNTGDIITCANNNEISGIHVIDNVQHGIVCSNVADVYIHDNKISVIGNSSFSSAGIGIYLQNCSGTVRISSNTLSLTNQFPWGIQIFTTAPGTDYFITNNTFLGDGVTNATGIELGHDNPSPLDLSNFGILEISGNQFSAMLAKSIGGRGLDGTGQVIIDTNTFSNWANAGGSADGDIFLKVRSTANINARITNNLWQNSVQPVDASVAVTTFPGAQLCLTLTNNASDSTGVAYRLTDQASTFVTDISGNTGLVGTSGLIVPGSCP